MPLSQLAYTPKNGIVAGSMKNPLTRAWLAGLAAVVAAGCAGHLDITPAGDPNRVLIGRVEARSSDLLPPDAVVSVRVVDPERTAEKPPSAVLGEPSPIPERSMLPPKILGEQIIKNPGQFPVAFRVEYTAIDDQLQRGLIVEARISFGGKVQYFNINSSGVTLTNFTDTHVISVNRL